MPQIVTRNYSPQTAQHLAASGIPPLLARIYAARGIADPAQLQTEAARLLPYHELKNARRMAGLLADAIAQRKKLLVVADYDADGATACTVALRGLRLFGADVDFIVPNRFEYGYGLTPEIVRLAHEKSPDILVTVDNGIASVDGVAEANRLGMQVLVTDHHLPGETLPDAACIVNPNQPGCAFPSKNLAGVGVMFYVLLALRAELRARGAFASPLPLAGEGGAQRQERAEPNPENPPQPSLVREGVAQAPPLTRGGREGFPEPNLAALLDLVALGTVADVVKLDDNNRILVHQGLQRIRAGRACAGINALLQIARKSPAQASSYELGFIVGPRLNAAGRLEDMSLGIRCLLTDDPAEAAQLAAQLDELNRARRDIEADMQEAALAALEQTDPSGNYSLALFDETWHQGVIGILASRLKDRFHRPTIVFARANDAPARGTPPDTRPPGGLGAGELKGSGRSIAGLHLRDALDLISKRHPHLLQKFGGHAMAAGVSILEQHFDEFRDAFESVAQELLSPADLTQTIDTDGTLDTQDFSLDIAAALERQVWGQGFPQPLFEGEFAVQAQRIVGEKHTKLRLGMPGASFDAIHFFSTEPLPPNIRAIYSLGINEYNGSASLQLIVRHWQEA